jgi:diguanylate cyclase
MAGHDHDYTLRIAELALERIKALSVPADPPGYELWYSYASNRNPEMNRRINRVIDEKGSLSALELDEIYDEFLSSSRTRSEIEQAGADMSHEIDKVVGMLGEFILSTAQGRGECSDASTRLAQTTDESTTRAIVDALIVSLRSVEVRHAAMEQRLSAAKQEMESLQQSLATASVEATRDPMTGLANRRGFNAAIARACERASSELKPFCLLMLDIDHFKSFNDRFGHLMGDSVIGLVGAMLKQSIKGQDQAARYGGEEFAVILPDTTLANAMVVADQIREKIMGRELKKRATGESLGKVTVSIGVSIHRPGERPRSIIERADDCLYEAKHAGRNCVRCEGDDGALRGNAA